MTQKLSEAEIRIGVAGLPADSSRALIRAAAETGARSVSFTTPRQMIKYVRESGVTALFLDLEWAKKGGQGLLAKLALKPSSPLNVVCSGKGQLRTCVELMRAGFDDFMLYPVNEAQAGLILDRIAALSSSGVGGGGLRKPNRSTEPLAELIRAGLADWLATLPDRKLETSAPGDWREILLSLMERELIGAVMDRFNGNRTRAAAFLGMHRNTLARKLGELKPKK